MFNIRIPSWPQWLAGIQVFLLAVTITIGGGWISPFIEKVSEPNMLFNITINERSWVGSINCLSRPIGVLVGTASTTLIGFKATLSISGIFCLLGGFALIFATSIRIVYLYLTCNGISLGIFFTASYVYVGEISNRMNRGKIVSLVVQGLYTGVLLGNICGAYLNPSSVGSIILAQSVIFLISFSFVPHSPHYLIKRNRKADAIKAISWYDRETDGYQEFEVLTSFIRDSPPLAFVASFAKVCNLVNLKIVIIMSILFALEKFSGMLTIHIYLGLLFKKSQVNVVPPKVMVIISSVFVIAFGWSAVYVNSHYKRTSTLFTGCAIISLTCVSWGFQYHLLALGYDSSNLQWIAIISAVVYRVLVIVCVVAVLGTLKSELFAPDIKSIAVGIIELVCAICSFAANKNFELLANVLTYHYMFYLFAAASLFMGVCGKMFVPETKGKSLEEIQRMLNGKTYSNSIEESNVEFQQVEKEPLNPSNKPL